MLRTHAYLIFGLGFTVAACGSEKTSEPEARECTPMGGALWVTGPRGASLDRSADLAAVYVAGGAKQADGATLPPGETVVFQVRDGSGETALSEIRTVTIDGSGHLAPIALAGVSASPDGRYTVVATTGSCFDVYGFAADQTTSDSFRIGSNERPVANPDTGTTPQGRAVSIAVLANDTDPDGDYPLSVADATSPEFGTAAIAGTSIIYTPAPTFQGVATFRYRCADTLGARSQYTSVTVTVTEANDPPAAVDDAAVLAPNATVAVDVLANDSDADGDPLQVIAVTQGTRGTATITGGGTGVSYTAGPVSGSDTFTYTIDDGRGGTATANVAVTIITVNHAPVAADDSATTAEDIAVEIAVLANDTDEDGNPLVAVIADAPTHGTAVVNLDGTVHYTPSLNYHGADSFTYRASDGGVTSGLATVSITVTPVNDVPHATDDTATTAEDTALVIAVLANDTDVDGDALSIESVTDPLHGSVTVNPDGTLTYVPDPQYDGSELDDFQYTARDPSGLTAIGAVTITVTAVNDAPYAADDSYAMLGNRTLTVPGPGVLGNDEDIEGDALTAVLVTPPASGTVSLGADGGLAYTPPRDFVGTASFTYVARDGAANSNEATVQIQVAADPPPVADAGPDQSVLADAATCAATVALDGSGSSSPDGAITDYAWSSGGVTLATGPTPTIGLGAGVHAITLTATDDQAVSDTDDVVITVTDATAPALTIPADLSRGTGPGATTCGIVISDAELGAASATDACGGVAIARTGVPAGNFFPTGTTTITYTAADGAGNITAATQTVTITDDTAPAVTCPAGTSAIGDANGQAAVPAVTGSVAATDGCTAAPAIAQDPTAGTLVGAGSHTITVTVTDGAGNSATCTTDFTVTPDTAPVANAGADQSVEYGSTVTLDGSGSTDADGHPLTYAWTFVSVPTGSLAALSDPVAVNPTFVADVSGSYVVQLVVNDGIFSSAADTVEISTANVAPVANAGADQTHPVTSVVTLDGTGSTDVDGDSLTYAWTMVSRPTGSTAALDDPASVMPRFTIDKPGSYIVQLVANDGTVDSDVDTVEISTRNSLPIANAGPDQTVFVTNTVTLDGSGSSDVDGDALTYAWSIVSTPDGSAAALSDTTAVGPTFVIDRPGTYVVQLVVNDGTGDSTADTVTISTTNSAPVANAGADATTPINQTVTLDASGSTDVDGDPLTYAWSLTTVPAGSTATLSDPSAVSPTFVADKHGIYVAQLIVNDGTVDGDPDTVIISTRNTAPVASAGADQSGFAGDTFTLDSSGSSDVDGDALTYAWSITSAPAGSSATLSSPTAASPTLVPDLGGTYVVQLIVSDAEASSDPDSVVITAAARTMTVATSSPLVGIGRSVTGTVTLAQPAGSGGVIVSLATSPEATVSPATLGFPAGATSAAFTITGATEGTATITASATYFADATADIGVTTSVVDLATGVVVGPSLSAPLGVTLSAPAPSGGVTVDLVSSDPQIITVSANVFIPEGAVSPAVPPNVTGVRLGTVQVTGTATGYAPHTVDVGSTLALSFDPAAISLPKDTTLNANVRLSAPAPADGLTIALASDNPGVASVPAAAFVPAGQTSVVIPVTGVSIASTTIHATAPGASAASAAVTVTTPPPITITSINVGKDLQAVPPALLGAPAPAGGVVLTITSSNPSKLLVASSPTAAGGASTTVTVPAGQVAIPAFYVQALADDGSLVELSASAPGYATGTATVSMRPSGFVITGPALDPITTTSFSANTTLTISAGVLNPGSLTWTGGVQAVRGGTSVSVPVTSSNPAVGAITTSPVVFSGGESTSTAAAFDPLTGGTTVIAAEPPPSFSTPSNARTRTFNVTAPAITLQSLTIGKDLQVAGSGALQSPPPSYPVQVTLTSTDPSRLLLSTSASGAGSPSIDLTVASGTSLPGFFVQSLDEAGTVGFTASAIGYTASSATASLRPSGFIIQTPTGDVTTSTFSANTPITVVSGALTPTTLAWAGLPAQQVRGGLGGVLVHVVSSDPQIGVITASPLVFNGGQASNVTAFDPIAAGATVVGVDAPTTPESPVAFSTPSTNRVRTFTVTAPGINVPAVTLGKDLETTVNASLQAAPPSYPVSVTVRSTDPNKVLIAPNATTAGSASLDLTINSGLNVPTFFVQALAGDASAVQFTVSATGYSTGSAPATLLPSGFVIQFPGGNPVATSTLSPPTPLTLNSGPLNATTHAWLGTAQPMRGGLTGVAVPVTSSNILAGVITSSPVIWSPGTSSNTTWPTAFQPLAIGTSVVAVEAPETFTLPTSANRTRTFNVSLPAINLLASVRVGADLQRNLVVNLVVPPLLPVDLVIESSSTDIVTIGTDESSEGSGIVTFPGVTNTSGRTFVLQGRAVGTAVITARAAGYGDAIAAITVDPSGFIISAPTSITTTSTAGNTTVTVASARLDPTTLNFVELQELRGGLGTGILVPVRSSDPNVGDLVNPVPPLSFGGNVGTQTTQFDPFAPGATVISVDPPAGSGFATPSNRRAINATVN